MYGNSNVEWFLFIPVSVTLSLNLEQRLLAERVRVYLYDGGPLVKTTTYKYDFDYYKHGQPLISKTTENDGKKKIVYHYRAVEKKRYRWEEKTAHVRGTLELPGSQWFTGIPMCPSLEL